MLVVATGPGYGSALLASCGARVTALEDDPALLALARSALAEFAPGVSLVSGPLAAGWPAGAPYDVILIEGAVADHSTGDRRAASQETQAGWRPSAWAAQPVARQCWPRPRWPACGCSRCSTAPRRRSPAWFRRRALSSDWCLADRCGTPAVDRTGARMVSRHGLLIGFGVALVAAPGFAQTPQSPPATAVPASQPPAKAAPPARRATTSADGSQISPGAAMQSRTAPDRDAAWACRARWPRLWRRPIPASPSCWPSGPSCGRPTRTCRRRLPGGGRPSCWREPPAMATA